VEEVVHKKNSILVCFLPHFQKERVLNLIPDCFEVSPLEFP
jgi:hypothetical protein